MTYDGGVILYRLGAPYRRVVRATSARTLFVGYLRVTYTCIGPYHRFLRYPLVNESYLGLVSRIVRLPLRLVGLLRYYQFNRLRSGRPRGRGCELLTILYERRGLRQRRLGRFLSSFKETGGGETTRKGLTHLRGDLVNVRSSRTISRFTSVNTMSYHRLKEGRHAKIFQRASFLFSIRVGGKDFRVGRRPPMIDNIIVVRIQKVTRIGPCDCGVRRVGTSV